MSLANRQVGPCVGVGGAIYLQPESGRTARSRETWQSARCPLPQLAGHVGRLLDCRNSVVSPLR
jgi:hypothetical protein